MNCLQREFESHNTALAKNGSTSKQNDLSESHCAANFIAYFYKIVLSLCLERVFRSGLHATNENCAIFQSHYFVEFAVLLKF